MLNKTTIIGRLGADPDIKSTAGGVQVCNLNVASNFTYSDKNGERVEEVEWHRISVFGKKAEVCGRYLQKGSLVFIEGRLKTRKFDYEGQTRYSTDIIAKDVIFLDKKKDRVSSGQLDNDNADDINEGDLPF